MSKVLILCEYATLNGGERSLLAVLSRMRSAEIDVIVAAPPVGPLAATLDHSGVARVAMVLHDGTGVRLPQTRCRDLVADLIAEQQPELVHANSLSMSRLVGPVVRGLRLNSLGHIRDIQRVNRTVITDLNCMDRLLTVSHATRDHYLALGLQVDRTQVLYNGVDLVQFRTRTPTAFLHRELQLPGSAKLLGCIGQLGMRKGVDVLLHAATEIVRRQPQAHFVIVGTRHSQKDEALRYEAELKEAASAPPLTGHVHWLGVRDDVANLLPEFSMLVHAARQEPLGRVLLEAAASGIACVVTDVGGTREIFPSESQGASIVPKDDAEAIASTVLNLLEKPTRLDVMGCAARRRAEAAFDAEVAATGLMGHYQDLLAFNG